MFRSINKLFNNTNLNLGNRLKSTYTPRTFFHHAHLSVTEPESLLKIADDFAKKGNLVQAEDVYKQIIEQNPYHKIAYEKLWSSWLKNSLKVPEQELEEFMCKYQKYIEPMIYSMSPK